MNRDELKLIYNALVENDGITMMPEWDRERQIALSLALDKLRREIIKRLENMWEGE